MLFSSTTFLFVFFPLVTLGYLVCPRTCKNLWLLVASLFFYAWGEPIFTLLLLASCVCNYLISLTLERIRQGWVLTFGILINLFPLLFYKYAAFFGLTDTAPYLPIGISFFTFQALSYLIDVYRDKVPANYNFIDMALYISFFPQLIAGPIVRYQEIAGQLRSRVVFLEDIEAGCKRFIIGLAKKVLLANQLAELVDPIFASAPDTMSASVLWLGVIGYALQIYFDFSGYSDMAIGLGQLFGFRLPENFRYPYLASSITDFWRRWHISLTNWFKDYVYIPLGGNRGSLFRTSLNIVIVFTLSGLWHGASWNFVLWGLWFGVLIALEKIWPYKTSRSLGYIYTLFAVALSWVLFRSMSLDHALLYYEQLFTFSPSNKGIIDIMTTKLWFILLISCLACTPILYRMRVLPLVKNALYLGVFILSLMAVATSTYQPFIYFQF